MKAPRLPRWVILDLTGRCNFRCLTCRYHESDRAEHRDMPPAIFAALAPVLRGADEIILGGIGEPLLADGFLDRIARIRAGNPGVRLVLFTNGARLADPSLAREVCRLIDWIHVSVNGLADYERIMRGGRREQMESALAHLAEIRRRTRRPAILEIGTVLLRSNLGDVVPIAELARRRGFDRLVYKDLRVFTERLRQESLRHDPALASAMRAEVERARRVGVALRCEPWPELSRTWPEVGRLRRGPQRRDLQLLRLAWDRRGWRRRCAAQAVPCRAPWESVQIDESGRVLLCCNRPTFIGDLRERSFEEIWRGEEVGAYRLGFQSGRPPEACRTCKLLVPDSPAAYEHMEPTLPA